MKRHRAVKRVQGKCYQGQKKSKVFVTPKDEGVSRGYHLFVAAEEGSGARLHILGAPGWHCAKRRIRALQGRRLVHGLCSNGREGDGQRRIMKKDAALSFALARRACEVDAGSRG